jgi:hypothetical protein
VQTAAETHALDHGWGDAFGVHDCFIGRHVVSQVVLVDASERSQERAQTAARTFATVAMDFAHAVAIIITRPFLDTVADARMLRMHAPIVRCLIGIQDDALRWHIPFNNGACGRLIGMLEHPIAHLVAAPADQTQDRWPVILIGALAFALHPEGTRRAGAVGQRDRDAADFFSPAF